MKFLIAVMLIFSSPMAQASYDVVNIPSENFGCDATESGRGEVKPLLVLAHCMGTTFERSLEILTLPADAGGGGVSAHYFIPQMTGQEIADLFPQLLQGQVLEFPDQVPVLSLVQEKDKAWHAGISRWSDFNELSGCENGLNACSIGIEFHAPGYANGDGSNWFVFKKFTAAQIETGKKLICDIYERWKLPPAAFLGHSDVAFGRKTDPGLYFPWEQFAALGLGVMWDPALEVPDLEDDEKVAYVQQKLKQIGYHCPQTREWDRPTQQAISAFRMHFMRGSWKHSVDDEEAAFLNGVIDAPLLQLLAGYQA